MELLLVAFTAAFFVLVFVMIQGVIRALSQVFWRRRRLSDF